MVGIGAGVALVPRMGRGALPSTVRPSRWSRPRRAGSTGSGGSPYPGVQRSGPRCQHCRAPASEPATPAGDGRTPGVRGSARWGRLDEATLHNHPHDLVLVRTGRATHHGSGHPAYGRIASMTDARHPVIADRLLRTHLPERAGVLGMSVRDADVQLRLDGTGHGLMDTTHFDTVRFPAPDWALAGLHHGGRRRQHRLHRLPGQQRRAANLRRIGVGTRSASTSTPTAISL